MQKLEDYISKIEKQLATLPIDQRQEELREIRLHLQQMVEDNIARGDSTDAAVAKALEQFGAAEKVGKALEGTREYSPLEKDKIKIKTFLIFILIYSTNLLLYLCTSIGIITGSNELTSGYLYFTGIVVLFTCGWMTESMNHKKLDVYFMRWFPVICLFFLWENYILHTKGFPFHELMFFVSIAAGARAYRWCAKYQTHSIGSKPNATA